MLAQVAVATGIAPALLMDDQEMLMEIVSVLQEQADERGASQ